MRFPHHRIAPAWFDALLNAEGLTYRIAHRRAHLCPCQDPRSSGPDPHCPRCGGVGYTWEDVPYARYEEEVQVPASREEAEGRMSGPTGRVSRAWGRLLEVVGPLGPVTGARLEEDYLVLPPGSPAPATYRLIYEAPLQGRGHAQSVRMSRKWAERGEVQVGDLVLTVPRKGPDGDNPAWDALPHDQIVLLDHVHRVEQRMVRGVKEVLIHPWVRELLRARALVAGQEVLYLPGEDFQVADGRVVWEAGRGPAPRTPYVLEYVAAPTYYVLEDLGQRRHIEGYDLPRRFYLRLFDAYPGRGR